MHLIAKMVHKSKATAKKKGLFASRTPMKFTTNQVLCDCRPETKKKQEASVSGEELVASDSDGLGPNPGIDAGAPHGGESVLQKVNSICTFATVGGIGKSLGQENAGLLAFDGDGSASASFSPANTWPQMVDAQEFGVLALTFGGDGNGSDSGGDGTGADFGGDGNGFGNCLCLALALRLAGNGNVRRNFLRRSLALTLGRMGAGDGIGWMGGGDGNVWVLGGVMAMAMARPMPSSSGCSSSFGPLCNGNGS